MWGRGETYLFELDLFYANGRCSGDRQQAVFSKGCWEESEGMNGGEWEDRPYCWVIW